MLIQLLIPLIVSHPRALAIALIAGVAQGLLAAAWQTIPSAVRDGWERKHPRAVGVARFLVELIANVVKATQIANHNVIQGKPRPEVAPIMVRPVEVAVPGTEGESSR